MLTFTETWESYEPNYGLNNKEDFALATWLKRQRKTSIISKKSWQVTDHAEIEFLGP